MLSAMHDMSGLGSLVTGTGIHIMHVMHMAKYATVLYTPLARSLRCTV